MKNLKYFIDKALKENFALGAVNFNNMETLQGVVKACRETSSPCIVSVSEGAFSYIGENYLMALFEAAKKDYPYIFLHLDHGKSFEICKKAVNLGFDSVMIDGSHLPFEENIALTKQVCDYAHKYNVLVEGELGQLKGVEDNVSSDKHIYTSPLQAKNFVLETGIDTLAVAIGTSHGAYKYSGVQTLRFDILEEIQNLIPCFPLVLHGASTVDENLISDFNSYGGQLEQASGIPKELLQKAVKNYNIIKINTDTDIRLSMTSEVRKVLSENKKEFDLRKYLGNGRDRIYHTVKDKIENIFFSDNKI